MPGRSASEQAESVRPGLAVGRGAQKPAPVAVALDAPDLDTAAALGGAGHAARVHGQDRPRAVPPLRPGRGRHGPRRQRGQGLPRPEAARHPQHGRGRRPGGVPAAPGDPHRARGRGSGHDQGGGRGRPGHDGGRGDPAHLDQRPRPGRSSGVPGTVSDAVRRMAVLAVAAGARGLVCSPQEVAAVRAEVGPDITLITPGIRPPGADSDDQARIATPVEAIKAGADLLVIGRPITRASDPGAAAATIAASLRRAAPAPSLARRPARPGIDPPSRHRRHHAQSAGRISASAWGLRVAGCPQRTITPRPETLQRHNGAATRSRHPPPLPASAPDNKLARLSRATPTAGCARPFPFGKNPAKAVPVGERGSGRSPQGSHWHQALLYDRRYVRPGQLYLRRFRRICTVIVALRRVKCPQARDERGTSPMTTKSAFITYKPHMSREVTPATTSAGGAGPAARASAAGTSLGWSLRRYVPGSSLRVWLNRRAAAGSRVADRPRWIGQSETDKRNILPMTGKGLLSCSALRNFRSRTTGQGARPALGYVE